MFKSLAAILPLLFLSDYISAQSIVSGKIVDTNNEQPIEYASVLVYQAADSAMVNGIVTDALGAFSVGGLQPGAYYITVQFMGYEHVTVSGVTLGRNETRDLGSVALAPSQKMLEEVEISGAASQN